MLLVSAITKTELKSTWTCVRLGPMCVQGEDLKTRAVEDFAPNYIQFHRN